MLNQQPYKIVKSSFYLKHLKSFLVSKFIKSKLYLLILLTVSTGGFFIGSSIIPDQIPPVQANSRFYQLFVQNLPAKLQMYSSDAIQIVCQGGGYGRKVDHVAELYQRFTDGWRLVHRTNVPYGDRTRQLRLNRGHYRLVVKSQSGGRKTSDLIVY
ncbi:hypothetical protein F7734_17725 [Scytonema sp. UIC 10036]|uniref:hypothetical protein n=1 Tax=Scytonema sp. UIC 10036 TaxID=2304196 RepID=UPI0012DAD88D|nr:hypothetical protein [Scytonema sp. UIC 10036]MUG94127.1 hypothetical protein [Scytonema sp. UIC 10036]